MQDLCGEKTDVFSGKELVGHLEGTVDGIGTGKGRSWKEKRRGWGGRGGGAAGRKTDNTYLQKRRQGETTAATEETSICQ